MSGEHGRGQSVDKLYSSYPVYHPLNIPTPSKAPRKRKNKEEGLSTPNIEISPVDPIWQTIDPTPDVQGLFTAFDAQFFGGRLSSVEVRWSPRMTLCAGQCVYEGSGGLCSIRLSEPLLKYRPRSDLVETLLHEMIHAYLFVTQNNRDRSAHGPSFKFHMNRINKYAKTNVTIFHSFHAEVDNYKVHWWKCNGSCANRPPFYGLVRRSMNRAPGPNDIWWAEHQANCSGQFIKILEPEAPKNTAKKSKKGTGKVKSKAKTSGSTPSVHQICGIQIHGHVTLVKNGAFKVCESDARLTPVDLWQFFQSASKPEDVPSSSSMVPKTTLVKESVVPFSGVGHRLGRSLSPLAQPPFLALPAPPSPNSSATASATDSNADPTFDASSDITPTGTVQCPVCFQSVPADYVNEHLDACLTAA